MKYNANKVGILAAVLALIVLIFPLPGCSTPAQAALPDIVLIAQSQLGKGEIGGDNKGKEVKKYTRGQEVAWCAGFVSWVFNQAGHHDFYFLAAKSFWNVKGGRKVQVPRAGDVIVFSRGVLRGHVGIVEKVQGQTITTIEGNVGPFPAVVKRKTYRLGNIKNLIGFVRLEPPGRLGAQATVSDDGNV